jgi:integrase
MSAMAKPWHPGRSYCSRKLNSPCNLRLRSRHGTPLEHGSVKRATRQYSRIVDSWVRQLGLDKASYGTHTLRRTKTTLIYRRTKSLRAVQLLLGHTKLESTVRYLAIEVNDALEVAEQTEV